VTGNKGSFAEFSGISEQEWLSPRRKGAKEDHIDDLLVPSRPLRLSESDFFMCRRLTDTMSVLQGVAP
jgi:hypothetical protein